MSGTKLPAVNMNAHNGLRGISAVWVMVFHCFFFSHRPWDLQGSSIMPLFFMLSGFSMAVAYRDSCDVNTQKFSGILAYYQNRSLGSILDIIFVYVLPCHIGFLDLDQRTHLI